MFILANRLNANVFFNELDASYKDDKRSRENLRFYNSSTVFDPNGERKLSYQKVFLLIFGEYMPFEFMYALSPQTGRFEPGKSLDLLSIYKKESIPDMGRDSPDF
jgi:apolipoprotein N-acyltransferase